MPTHTQQLIPGVPVEKQNPRAWRERSLPAEQAWFQQMEPKAMVDSCNPFAKIYPIGDHVFAIYNRSTSGATDSWSFLIIGRDKAALIDTGHAIGDLKQAVEHLLNGMPFIVINTHCHADHNPWQRSI